jgi:hypothetical protein
MEETTKVIAENLVQILAGSGAIAAMLLRQWIWRVASRLLGKKKPAEDEARGPDLDYNLKIYEVIIELRMKLGADRVHVVQFHNGDYFLAGNSFWKLTCTHETCHEGVSFEARGMQAIVVSQMANELAWLWDRQWRTPNAMPPPGISRVGCPRACTPHPDELKVVHIETAKLIQSHFRTSLEARGTKIGLSAPLLSNSGIVGFLGVDYTAQTLADMQAAAPEVCDAAKRVAYYLRPGGAV